MSDPINLKEHKTKRKYEKIVKDIDSIILVFDLTVKGLTFFKNYIVVSEVISVIMTNASILKMQQSKMQKELDKMGETK